MSSSWCDVYLYEGDSDDQSIFDQQQEIKLIVVNMLQNLNHKYFSNNRNIKYVGSTIKCIGFELIHHAINLNVIPFSMVFRDFNFMLFINVLLV